MYLFVFACMKYYCKHQLLDFFLNFERDTPCHHVISIYPGSISVEAQGTCFFTIVPVIQKYPVHPRKLTAGYPSDALEKRCTPKKMAIFGKSMLDSWGVNWCKLSVNWSTGAGSRSGLSISGNPTILSCLQNATRKSGFPPEKKNEIYLVLQNSTIFRQKTSTEIQ